MLNKIPEIATDFKWNNLVIIPINYYLYKTVFSLESPKGNSTFHILIESDFGSLRLTYFCVHELVCVYMNMWMYIEDGLGQWIPQSWSYWHL